MEEHYNEKGQWSSEWGYIVEIYEITKNNVKFAITFLGRNCSPVIGTTTTGKLNGNKIEFAYDDDGWGSSGKGVITVNKGNIVVNVEDVKISESNRGTLSTENIILHSENNTSTLYDKIKSFEKEIFILINGKQLSFDVAPYRENGTTMVPIRAIFEELGAKVSYNDKTKTVTAQKGSTVIELITDSINAKINGKLNKLTVAVVNKNGSTMIPLRFVSEAFGADVNWDNNTNTVIINL